MLSFFGLIAEINSKSPWSAIGPLGPFEVSAFAVLLEV